MSNAAFDGTDDFFDSRDVIERINEMELEYGPEDGDSIDTVHTEKMTVDERMEYAALVKLRDEAEGYVPDFEYGETFHTWESLKEYTQELVNDCYSSGLPSWVTRHIDWEAVAEEIKVDYTEFEFRGTTYYAR